MNYEKIRLEVDAAGIATVMLAKPPVNALDRQIRDEITHVFDTISDRDDVRVAILTGEGKVFCGGADIKERVDMKHEPGDYIRHNRQVRESFLAIMECSKPVIAAVNGPAIGAGLTLMLASDIMFASETAFVNMPEIDVGLSGGQRLVVEHFSRSRGRLMYYTGRRIYAAELYRLGIIEACLPPEHLMEEARVVAAEIAEKSPMAIRSAKKTLNLVEHLPYRVAYPYEQSITAELSQLEDTREAQRAFLEKRRPVFKGR